MCSIPPPHILATADQSAIIAQLQTELAVVRAELASLRAERDQFRATLVDLLADQVQLRAHLADTQAQLAAVEVERQQTRQELVEFKRKPFVAHRAITSDAPAKARGRPLGHAGAGRSRPPRIDRTQVIPAGDTGPDCGTPFSGVGTTRERVVEDLALVRPTGSTK
jgi:uncharacterized membrane-anchored protein YhcB (DUF1043 family)